MGNRLAQMERGELKRDAFMRGIVDMTKRIVGQAKEHEADTIDADFGTLEARCPKCGGEVHEKYKKFQCQSCAFGFWKIVAGRQLELHEADELSPNAPSDRLKDSAAGSAGHSAPR